MSNSEGDDLEAFRQRILIDSKIQHDTAPFTLANIAGDDEDWLEDFPDSDEELTIKLPRETVGNELDISGPIEPIDEIQQPKEVKYSKYVEDGDEGFDDLGDIDDKDANLGALTAVNLPLPKGVLRPAGLRDATDLKCGTIQYDPDKLKWVGNEDTADMLEFNAILNESDDDDIEVPTQSNNISPSHARHFTSASISGFIPSASLHASTMPQNRPSSAPRVHAKAPTVRVMMNSYNPNKIANPEGALELPPELIAQFQQSEREHNELMERWNTGIASSNAGGTDSPKSQKRKKKRKSCARMPRTILMERMIADSLKIGEVEERRDSAERRISELMNNSRASR
eukprot:TRINITY_DN777897_c0_g1_i1.p1 TRINITY_DN777897_c0_g1~~TRINITY_DN777897_c0_g1_i1.p1  ORF type:complete len:342 (-),score=97.99 TRINITY_DN777897_c0_g1_i1:182-1207(-)